jgi:hypothetical protein
VAPALRSFIVFRKRNATDILELLRHSKVDLRKLSLEGCYLDEMGSAILAKILDLYQNLEVLSLRRCNPLTSFDYCRITHLKKLSELNILECQVDYVCVKLLEMLVCIREHM